jgi:hypothetical protein
MQVTSWFVHLNRVEHNGENVIWNAYHMSEINHFKVFYYVAWFSGDLPIDRWCGSW